MIACHHYAATTRFKKKKLMVTFSKLMTLAEVKTPDISNLGSTFSVT